jgi:hypothetical protein
MLTSMYPLPIITGMTIYMMPKTKKERKRIRKENWDKDGIKMTGPIGAGVDCLH